MPSCYSLRCALVVVVLAGSAGMLRADPPSPEQLEFFEKKIRPLLADNCYQCHSEEAQKKRKLRGGLFLDSRAGLVKGGDTGPALAVKEPEKSLLLRAIAYTDPDLKMPPRGKLNERELADLTAWVKLGAPWPDSGASKKVAVRAFNLQERRQHWSLQPVKRPELPTIKQKDWPQTPIDHFILAKLEEKGLAPSPPAEPATLLRRLHFDLVGLPPTPTEVDSFRQAVSRNRQAALEEVVERLLASPQYGERWARHWLDLVRFAETYGHEFDFEIPEAWRYRDYLIRAFNADVPYDQLVREHLAGDLLPRPRREPKEKFNESIIGTGFWWLGEAKHSPVDSRGDQADRIDNQIDVFGKTFLGTTLACARCHDHKFDAITQRDYYAIAGFVQSTHQQRAFIDDGTELGKTLEQLKTVRNAVEAVLEGHSKTLQKELRQLKPAEQKATNAERQRWREWHGRAAKLKLANVTSLLNLLNLEGDRYSAARQQLLQGWQKSTPSTETVFADFRGGNYAAWFVSGKAFGERPLRPHDWIMTSSGLPSTAGAALAHSGAVSGRLEGAIRSQTFTIQHRFIHYLAGGSGARLNLVLDGLQLIRAPIYGGLTLGLNGGHEPRWLTMDVSMWQGHRAYIEVLDDGPGFAVLERVVFSPEGPPPAPVNPLLLQTLVQREAETPEGLATRLSILLEETARLWTAADPQGLFEKNERQELLSALLRLMPMATDSAIAEEVASLLKDYRRLEASLPTSRRALAMEEGTPINERLHIRGSHRNLGEEVPRRFLEVLAGKGPPQTRLELAEQIASAQNPLTARVLVNRLWKHHFGTGIVSTVDDFGALGQPPTHPELLDWLAAEFVQKGWSLKKMHRLMVLSAVYQQASTSREPAPEADPANQLLHRFPVRRLEAESIRDSLLAISGRLDLKMFGPGVLPHLTPHMAGRGRPGASGPLDGSGRRSLYINVRRNFLTPLFLVFDYPVPFSTIGRRSVSNVPAQALTLLNNPFVLQQTELWARKVLAEPDLSNRQRIERMYLVALGRPPAAEELADALAFVEQLPPEASRAEVERQWADLAHVLVNVKEFIYLN